MCTPPADLVAESLALAEVLLPEGLLRILFLGFFLRFSYGVGGMYLPPKSVARIDSSASESP